MDIQALRNLMYANTSPTGGAFSPNMTDKQWQEKFAVMKTIAVASSRSNMKSMQNGIVKNGKYDGETNHQRYASYINDILKNIRKKGGVDYCYRAYQVNDLLKYEKDRLRTKYYPDGQYVKVWLDFPKKVYRAKVR